jgi:hypothetical protein
MALLDQEKDLGPLYKEILLFLWSNTVNQETIQKKRLVFCKGLSVSLDKGGLEIQHPKEVAAGHKMKIVKKLYKKSGDNRTTLNKIMDQLLTIR